jgi:hypothetical protein
LSSTDKGVEFAPLKPEFKPETFPTADRDALVMGTKKPRQCVVILREPDWIRTNDLLLRRQLLYPTELPVHIFKLKYSPNFFGERKNSLFP